MEKGLSQSSTDNPKPKPKCVVKFKSYYFMAFYYHKVTIRNLLPSLLLYDYCHLNYFSIVLCAGRFHANFNYAEQLNNHSLMNKIYIYL